MAGSCAKEGLFSGTSFCIRRGRGVNVVNVGNAKGSALLGVITNSRRPSRKAIAATGRVIVGCLPRGPRFSPSRATLRRIVDHIIASRLSRSVH